jgi:hypothetical protein
VNRTWSKCTKKFRNSESPTRLQLVAGIVAAGLCFSQDTRPRLVVEALCQGPVDRQAVGTTASTLGTPRHLEVFSAFAVKEKAATVREMRWPLNVADCQWPGSTFDLSCLP